MYEYTCDGVSPAHSKQIWSRLPLQPFSDILSPFSYTVLAEISRRAWFRYYERMGRELPLAPRHIMRHHYGRPYLDIKWICERDVELAGLEPMVFRVNGELIPVCKSVKPGWLAGLRNGRNQRRIQAELEQLMQEMAAITTRARSWYEKVSGMRWTQAEILQIMEEIERHGADSLMAFYAARHNLERAYNRLLQLPGKSSAGERIQMVNNTLSDLHGLVELALTDELLQLAKVARQDQSIRAWLAKDRFEAWETTLG